MLTIVIAPGQHNGGARGVVFGVWVRQGQTGSTKSRELATLSTFNTLLSYCIPEAPPLRIASAPASVFSMEPSPLTQVSRPELFQPKIISLYETLFKVRVHPFELHFRTHSI